MTERPTHLPHPTVRGWTLCGVIAADGCAMRAPGRPATCARCAAVVRAYGASDIDPEPAR